MVPIPQSTAFTVVFKAFLSSDHVSEATGKTIAITISKAGAAFANPAAGALNATEIASGWYKAALGTGDIDTLGILAIRGTAGTIDDYGDRFFVVQATNGGLTALPNTAATTNASLLTSGTGTDQLSVTSGRIDIGKLLGTAWLTPGTAGTPDVNVKLWNGLTTVALPLIPTTAGRTLDVSSTGEAGLDWANVGSPTTTLALTGTTIATTQKVDVETIKTNPVVNAGTITFPTTATLASTTNITAGTITTVGTLTTYTGNTPQTGDNYARLGAPAGASVSADIAAAKTDTAAIKVQTDKFVFTVANQVDSNVLDWKSATAPAMTGDAFARLGAPVGASISADIAEIEGETDTLLAGVTVTTNNDKTGYSLTQTFPTNFSAQAISATGIVSADIKKVNAVTVTGDGAGTPWGP